MWRRWLVVAVLAALGAAQPVPGEAVWGVQVDPLEPNDSLELATPVELPFRSPELSVSSPDDIDFFAFELPARAYVVADVDAASLGSTLDPVMAVFDAGGNILDESDDVDGLDPRLARTLEAGRYVLGVRGFGESTGPYRVSLMADENPPERHDSLQSAKPIELPYAEDGLRLEAPNESAFFTFELRQRALLHADVDAQVLGSPLDGVLELLDDAGGLIAGNDDSDGLDPRLDLLLEPGRYVLAVSGLGGSTGFYRLSVHTSPLRVDDAHCREAELAPFGTHAWDLGAAAPGEEIQVLLEIPAGSRFAFGLQEVVSVAPSLVLTVAQGYAERSPGLLVYDVLGDAARSFLIQVVALAGGGSYRLCWAPLGG